MLSPVAHASFTCRLSEKPTGAAVTWSVTGKGCTGNACGVINGDSSGFYTAPVSISTRAVDQKRQAGGQDYPFFLSPFPLQRGAAGAEPTGLQPGQLVATAGPATTNRELVADEFAATAGENGRTAGETCALLLASLSGRTSEPAAVRGDAGSHRTAADKNGIQRATAAKPINRVVKEEVLHPWAGCGVTSPAMMRIIDGWERLRWNSVQNTPLEIETRVQCRPFSEQKGNPG